jgi:hypothetical protein
MGIAIQLNGSVVWGFVLEVGRGLRLRLSVDDWERLSINPGQRIPVRIPNRFDASLVVGELVEVPPVVWIMLTHRVCDVRTTPGIIRGQIRRQITAACYMVSFPRVVERLHSLVLRDQRYPKLGIRGLVRVAFDEVAGRVPTTDEINEVVGDFWEFWHEQHDKPQSRQEMWASSRHRTREDLSPRQENAIRAMEDVSL